MATSSMATPQAGFSSIPQERVAPLLGHWAPLLYRGFAQKEHLASFASGSIRFGRLDSYREAPDDTRRDATEALADVRSPDWDALTAEEIVAGRGGFTGTLTQAVYIACFTSPRASPEVRAGFGPYAARVRGGGEFLRAVADAARMQLATTDLRLVFIEGSRVRYRKGMARRIRNGFRMCPYYDEKPERFGKEHEWRIVLYCSRVIDGSPESVTLNLADPGRWIEAIDSSTSGCGATSSVRG